MLATQKVNRDRQNQEAPTTISKERFARQFDHGYSRTKHFLMSKGVPIDRAEEVAQGAWARAWERRDTLRNAAALGTWVNSIALNLFRNSLRREKFHQELPDENEIAAQHSEPKIEKIDVERALRLSRGEDRELLGRRYILGYNSSEMAKEAGCKHVTMRVRIMRARARLRSLLKSDYPDANFAGAAPG